MVMNTKKWLFYYILFIIKVFDNIFLGHFATPNICLKKVIQKIKELTEYLKVSTVLWNMDGKIT